MHTLCVCAPPFWRRPAEKRIVEMASHVSRKRVQSVSNKVSKNSETSRLDRRRKIETIRLRCDDLTQLKVIER
jgi:hypothetical protein